MVVGVEFFFQLAENAGRLPHQPAVDGSCSSHFFLRDEDVYKRQLYAQFRAPARRIYADEAADFLTLSPDEEAGSARLLAPAQLQLLYS